MYRYLIFNNMNKNLKAVQNERCRILEGGTDEMKNVVYLPLTVIT